MDTLESCPIGVMRHLLGSVLREHRSSRQCHYAVDMTDDHEDSLASYVGLNLPVLCSILVACGLAYYHGGQYQIHQKMGNNKSSDSSLGYSWESFLIEHKLGGYFDVACVNGKCHTWIRLGGEEASAAKNGPFNPMTQRKYYKGPPRVAKKQLRKRVSMLTAVQEFHKKETVSINIEEELIVEGEQLKSQAFNKNLEISAESKRGNSVIYYNVPN
jgi:hypothetical protein